MVTVVFGSREVQHVHDEAEFEALKEEAKAAIAKYDKRKATWEARAEAKKKVEEAAAGK